MNVDIPLRLFDYDHRGLRIEIDRMIATKDSKRIKLSPTEWKVLIALVRANNKKLTLEDLHLILYGGGEKSNNTVKIFINNLRRKIGKEFIHTYRGQGYVIANLVD